MSEKKLSIYMAGPDVFFENALEIAAQKKDILERFDLEGHHPFDNNVMTAGKTQAEIAQNIFTENVAMMDRCDLILANLTPFRGPSADVGTIFEIGYMYARQKPIFGYSNIADEFITRIEAYNKKPLRQDKDGMFWDSDDLNAENFGLRDNLMIDCAFVDQAQAITARTEYQGALSQIRDFAASAVPEGEIHGSLKAFKAQAQNIARLRDEGLLFLA